jgi:hypothetical protein
LSGWPIDVESGVDAISKVEVAIVDNPGHLWRPFDDVWLLDDLVARELLPRQIDVHTSKAIPIMESLACAIPEMHFGLEQLAPEEVTHDQSRDRALPTRRVVGCPRGDVGRIAGVDRPRGSNGRFQGVKGE